MDVHVWLAKFNPHEKKWQIIFLLWKKGVKENYLSYPIRCVADLMILKNAIFVNLGQKRGAN